MNYFHNTTLAVSSVKLFNTRINKWLDLLPIKDVQYIIMFPAHALHILYAHLKQTDINNPLNKKKAFNSTNIHSYISAINAVIKHSSYLLNNIPQLHTYYKLWIDICEHNSKYIVKKRYDNVPTDMQIIKGAYNITYQDIVNKRHSTDNLMDTILLAIYTDIYPVRADYYALGIIKEGEHPFSDNYIILKDNTAELILTKFKTAKRYKKIHYPII
jgi:hypothetical protein